MPPLELLVSWIDRLVGLDPDRVRRSAAAVASWPIPDLARRLGDPRDVDDAVRAVLLVDAVELLVHRGVPMSKLMSKLRDTRQFEATWAELRCAAVILNNADGDVQIELEAGRSSGKQADMRLLLPEGSPHTSVEVKAVGWSDTELAFMRRMSPALDSVIPPHGFVTLHAELDAPRPIWPPRLIDFVRLDAARWAASVPGYPAGLSGVAIVAQGAERQYVRRAVSGVTKAIRQLPAGDECWVALHWTNGAPIDDVIAELEWTALPPQVQGIAFVGSVVAFPHREINVFQILVPRDVDPHAGTAVTSTLNDRFATTVLERTEGSSGVRATLLRGTIRGKRRQLLRRGGSQRLPPFNLLLDGDPADACQRRLT